MSTRRKHSKISEFPEELREAIHRKLANGATYEELTNWINEQAAHHGTETVGKSSVARYGKDFLARLDRLKVVSEQARAVLEYDDGAPDTDLMSASNKIALSLITETLMKVQEGDLSKEKLSSVFRALAQLQRANVATEKLKWDVERAVQAASERIKEGLRKELQAQPELLARIMGLVDDATSKTLG